MLLHILDKTVLSSLRLYVEIAFVSCLEPCVGMKRVTFEAQFAIAVQLPANTFVDVSWCELLSLLGYVLL